MSHPFVLLSLPSSLLSRCNWRCQWNCHAVILSPVPLLYITVGFLTLFITRYSRTYKSTFYNYIQDCWIASFFLSEQVNWLLSVDVPRFNRFSSHILYPTAMAHGQGHNLSAIEISWQNRNVASGFPRSGIFSNVSSLWIWVLINVKAKCANANCGMAQHMLWMLSLYGYGF